MRCQLRGPKSVSAPTLPVGWQPNAHPNRLLCLRRSERCADRISDPRAVGVADGDADGAADDASAVQRAHAVADAKCRTKLPCESTHMRTPTRARTPTCAFTPTSERAHTRRADAHTDDAADGAADGDADRQSEHALALHRRRAMHGGGGSACARTGAAGSVPHGNSERRRLAGLCVRATAAAGGVSTQPARTNAVRRGRAS